MQSSIAIILMSELINGPFALYWFIVIIVLAGAVAQAMEPSKNEKARSNPKITFITNTTANNVIIVSHKVITKILVLSLESFSNITYLPTPKAINPRAISEIKSKFSAIPVGIKFKTDGPIKIPAIIYPVASGRWSNLVILVIKKPIATTIVKVSSIAVDGDSIIKLSIKLPSKLFKDFLHFSFIF